MGRALHRAYATRGGYAHSVRPLRPEPSLLQIVTRYSWLILACVALSLAGAVAYLAAVRPIYSSTARICVQPAAPRVAADLPGVGSLLNSLTYLNTQCEVIRSHPVLSMALEAVHTSFGSRGAPGYDAIETCRSNLRVEAGRRDDVITITFQSPDADYCAAVTNAIVDAYGRWHAEQQHRAVGKARALLQEQKERWELQLERETQALAEFRRSWKVPAGADLSRPAGQRVMQLSNALGAAQIEVLAAQAALQSAEQVAGDPQAWDQVAGAELASLGLGSLASELARLRSSLHELELRRVSYARQYLEGHPNVRRTDASIAELKAKIAQQHSELAEAYLAAARHRLAEATQKQEQLLAALREQEELADQIDACAARYVRLDAAVKRTAKVCEALDTRLKELAAGPEASPCNLIVLQRAQPVRTPSYPPRGRVLGIAVLVGLAVGGGTAVLRESRDHRFRCSREIVAALDLPVLAVIPAGSWPDPPEAAFSPAECWQVLRIALDRTDRHRRLRSVLVVSPAARERSSQVAWGLACVMAQAGRRTLLIDEDLRTPCQDSPDSAALGLRGLLTGVADWDAAVVPGPIPALHRLPWDCGRSIAESVPDIDLLGETLREAERRYDLVVVGCAPVESAAEAQILAQLCNATLLVLRANSSTLPEAQRSLEVLYGACAQVLGVVVTDAPGGRRRLGEAWHCLYPAGRTPPGAQRTRRRDKHVPNRRAQPREAA